MVGAMYFLGSAMLLIPLVLVCIASYLSRNLTMADTREENEEQVHHNRGYQKD